MKRLIALPNQKIPNTLEDMWLHGNVESENDQGLRKAEEQDTQYRKSPPEAKRNSAGPTESLPQTTEDITGTTEERDETLPFL